MISLSDISVNGFLNLQNYIFYQHASIALWTWEKIEKKLKLSLLLSNCYSVIFHNIPFTQCQPHTSRHVTKIIKLIFSFIVYRKRHYVRSKLWLYRQQKKMWKYIQNRDHVTSVFHLWYITLSAFEKQDDGQFKKGNT